MMTFDRIQEELKNHRPEDVASGTGLAYHTVLRYRDGKVKEPPHHVVMLLAEYLQVGEDGTHEGD